ncbi:S-adenosyl-L-methionine-dependent methyltransferase [Abortiporus biennis]|nr:S-adenosyl-L-methionine-dependent methyltransferase [Abortiporus biennis]
MPMSLRAIEFYSGIGGLHLALSSCAVAGSVVRAYDWDQSTCKVYEARYGPGIVKKADISLLTAQELAWLNADIWLCSPSCQPYTVLNPQAKGEGDSRAKSFIHLIENVLPSLVEMKQHPRYLLVENVAGFETSSTRQKLLRVLFSLGYSNVELLLTPLQFGVPNSRLRYYLLAKFGAPFAHLNGSEDAHVWRHIPGKGTDWADPRSDLAANAHQYVTPLEDYLDLAMNETEFTRFSVSDKVLEKWGRLFDIVLPSSRRSCCFTRGYTKLAERAGSILQMNEALDTTEVFDRFLEAQKSGDPEAVRILDCLRLRYFSPDELLRIFCFQKSGDEPFKWPKDISLKTQYKLIGNSVNVRVVRELIEYLLEN